MNELLNYGVLGIVVVALAGYVLLIEKRHKDERGEWQKTNKDLTEETNKNIRENTSVLSALKTLLEIRR